MLGFARQEGKGREGKGPAYLVGVCRWRRAAALPIVAAKGTRGASKRRRGEVKGERGGTHRSDALGPSDWMASRLIFASIIAVRGR